ncbi:MAG: C69 family dipeptidase [Marinilabiliaceae bacterium]|jgi:dipeptidase|nr:C69 family dipeptidase [Marinilabiliaceae bacterium]
MRNIKLVLLLILGTAVFTNANAQYLEQFIESDNCTSVIVGKKASADGSTMTSHSCDSGTDRTWINLVPHRTHKAGSETPVYFQPKRSRGPEDNDIIEAGYIKQVKETYAFINTAYPVINEYQLAIGETTFGGKRELVSDAGLIDCPELYRLALERAKTAREAIKVIDELTKEYGYNDVGECFTFADPNETWHFEILGPGKGKVGAVWAAVRIPDDEVGVSANASRIRKINLDDPDNYLASENVFSLAQEMGWWDPESGEEFEFCYAYANRRSMACRRREWRVLSLVAPGLNLDPNGENYPLSVKPENLLTVKDVLDIFRDYYQETPYDMTASLIARDRRGEYSKSPVANPFMDSDTRNLLGVASERTIACPRATYVQVTQSRNWLPDPIGGIVWLGYDNPCTTPHIPFYCGIERMPESFMVDGRREFSRECAWWAFRRVSQLSYNRYQVMSKDIESVWKTMEDGYFSDQAAFEQKMLELYKKDSKKVKEELTKYSVDRAEQAVERYWKLGDELWTKYNNYF